MRRPALPGFVEELHSFLVVLLRTPTIFQETWPRPEKATAVVKTLTDEDFTEVSVTSANRAHAPPQQPTTTWTHPFWDATCHRWTDVQDLTPGTRLTQPDDSTATVTAVRNYTAHLVTYDLTIAHLHTFYVLAGTEPVLVQLLRDERRARRDADPAAQRRIDGPRPDSGPQPAAAAGTLADPGPGHPYGVPGTYPASPGDDLVDRTKDKTDSLSRAPGDSGSGLVNEVAHTPDGVRSTVLAAGPTMVRS